MNTSKRDLNTAIPPELQTLSSSFLERRLLEAQTLQKLLGKDDYPAIEGIAHKLKGNGTAYGFPAISSVGSDLEFAAKLQDRSSVCGLIEEFRLIVIHFLNVQ